MTKQQQTQSPQSSAAHAAGDLYNRLSDEQRDEIRRIALERVATRKARYGR